MTAYQQPPPTHVVVDRLEAGPGCLVRALWFIFVGWWLSGIVVGLAYLACLTIIGLPIGFALFNRLPVVLTLRPRTDVRMTQVSDGVAYVRGGTVRQRPTILRALWFILVGWWLGGLYISVAWGLCVIIITLPVGLWLFNRVGAVMTLLRY
jgi:uncharacterized membrane protein YccF (DUF307 family)